MFTKIILDYEDNLFHNLQETINFENITKGRKGCVLVNNENDLIPIVRTTTKYTNPAQKFTPIYHNLITKIKETININELQFNNALVEIYDNSYCKMGFHSDQSLDLEDKSYIAIYSCYENPSHCRKLIVKNKITNDIFEILMTHNSVIIFNLETNKQHLHKIILDNNISNKWLGVTLRLSKTFIQHIDDCPNIYKTLNILKLADNKETKEFYKLRSEENKSINFIYPLINYTISNSDLIKLA